MLLLDTNVLSEIVSKEIDPMVQSWFRARSSEEFWTSAIVVMELRVGAVILPAGKRRAALAADIENLLFTLFPARILSFDEDTAAIYADLAARLRRAGTPVGQSDMMIAATALQYGGTVITRNTRDFTPCGVLVANPFEGP